jgi:ZIP family zinc transporter/zinc and cadmium transporter
VPQSWQRKGNDVLFALVLGIITAIANILGTWLAILQRQPSRGFTAGSLGFSGGFILAAALLEMVPESLERGPSMPLFVVLGYLIVFLIEQLLNVHLHHFPAEGNHSHVPIAPGIASLVAFNAHDFIDGVAMGSAMVSDRGLGIIVFLAVLLHEVPAGFVIAAIVRGAGWSRRSALLAGGSLGIVTLIGIVLPYWVYAFSPFVSDALLALAAGTFIYVGATLLVPLSEAGKSRWITLMVVIGFVVFLISDRALKLFL